MNELLTRERFHQMGIKISTKTKDNDKMERINLICIAATIKQTFQVYPPISFPPRPRVKLQVI